MTGTGARRSGCPSWCDSDHARDTEGLPPLHFAAPGRSVRLADAPGAEHVFVFVSQREGERDPHLIIRAQASDAEPDPALTVRLKDADGTARLIEILAVASGQAHREVAAAIRRAADAARGGER